MSRTQNKLFKKGRVRLIGKYVLLGVSNELHEIYDSIDFDLDNPVLNFEQTFETNRVERAARHFGKEWLRKNNSVNETYVFFTQIPNDGSDFSLTHSCPLYYYYVYKHKQDNVSFGKTMYVVKSLQHKGNKKYIVSVNNDDNDDNDVDNNAVNNNETHMYNGFSFMDVFNGFRDDESDDESDDELDDNDKITITQVYCYNNKYNNNVAIKLRDLNKNISEKFRAAKNVYKITYFGRTVTFNTALSEKEFKQRLFRGLKRFYDQFMLFLRKLDKYGKTKVLVNTFDSFCNDSKFFRLFTIYLSTIGHANLYDSIFLQENISKNKLEEEGMVERLLDIYPIKRPGNKFYSNDDLQIVLLPSKTKGININSYAKYRTINEIRGSKEEGGITDNNFTITMKYSEWKQFASIDKTNVSDKLFSNYYFVQLQAYNVSPYENGRYISEINGFDKFSLKNFKKISKKFKGTLEKVRIVAIYTDDEDENINAIVLVSGDLCFYLMSFYDTEKDTYHYGIQKGSYDPISNKPSLDNVEHEKRKDKFNVDSLVFHKNNVDNDNDDGELQKIIETHKNENDKNVYTLYPSGESATKKELTMSKYQIGDYIKYKIHNTDDNEEGKGVIIDVTNENTDDEVAYLVRIHDGSVDDAVLHNEVIDKIGSKYDEAPTPDSDPNLKTPEKDNDGDDVYKDDNGLIYEDYSPSKHKRKEKTQTKKRTYNFVPQKNIINVGNGLGLDLMNGIDIFKSLYQTNHLLIM